MAAENTGPDRSLTGVAIIGMAARFPGAKNVKEFWNNLIHGVESIATFSDEDLIESGVDIASVRNDSEFVARGGVLEGAELFDADFFGVNPKEAELMDPQGRVILECSWEAIEDSGYDPETYPGSIAVYVGGSTSNTYFLTNLHPNRHKLDAINSFQTLVNNEVDSLAMRISYKLNLKGPSVTVLTTCSTSLVAVYHACQSLLDNQCDIALAGGVSLRLPQKQGYWYQEGGMNSRDGHCRPFDERAQGTVFGNGVGIVVVKRLADALNDRDNIYAVIKGIAINNDGSGKRGYAAPSIDGQAAAIMRAQAAAGVSPDSISYVEAHGTATPVGDPIEVAALTRAFRRSTDRKRFCVLGSVKSNIGHLDTTSGVAGLIKSALGLRYQVIPPTLHYNNANPKLDIENTPFRVVDKLTEWKTDKRPRRAGLNSFGVGGTNAHAVLEEAPCIDSSSSSRSFQLLLLSAKTETALTNSALNLAAHLDEAPRQSLADVAYTLQVGRKAFNHRRFLVCKDRAAAMEMLRSPETNRSGDRVDGSERSVVFMFPGQGSQYVSMGLELYRSEPTFQEHIDRCGEILEPLLGIDPRNILYPDAENEEQARAALNQTVLTQPVIFSVEYALARLWMEWGIFPKKMIGHSVGEYTAACLSGVFGFADALSLLAVRGKLMQDLPTGAMLAVAAREEEVSPLLHDGVSLAAVNGPSNCVIAGPKTAIEAIEQELAEKEIRGRYLQTSHAFHSSMMDPILEKFGEAVRKIPLSPPSIPFISSSTGQWITPEQAMSPDYWVGQLRKPVRFHAARQQLANSPDDILLEVGPGSTLCNFARHPSYDGSRQIVLSSLSSHRKNHQEIASLLTTLGQLWLEGVQVDWRGFYARERRCRVSLPTYPFEKKRYWVDLPTALGDANLSPRSTTDAAESRKNSQPPHVQPTPMHPAPAVLEPFLAASRVSKHPAMNGDGRSGLAIEKIFSQQLEVMAKQLEVLRNCRPSQARSQTLRTRLADHGDGLRGKMPDNGLKREATASSATGRTGRDDAKNQGRRS